MTWLEKAWYSKTKINYLLAPLSLLFWLLSSLRRVLFQIGIKKQSQFPLPVIVVGNISVGGTGKTPFVIYLVELLRKQGFNPAIVSRGYGASPESDDTNKFPRLITSQSEVSFSGDEPKLLAMRTNCPVVIDANRSRAIEYVCESTDCNIVISDDGLQHYAMTRDIEIVLLDKSRMFGNGWLLPVGPLRELPSRLKQVDLVLHNSGFVQDEIAQYTLNSDKAFNLLDQQVSLPLGEKVNLISGIGNPERFSQTAKGMGYQISSQNFLADHHQFTLSDFAQYTGEDIILMTEKDAVKCRTIIESLTDKDTQSYLKRNCFVLPISASISKSVEQTLLELLQKLPKKGK